MMRSRLSGLPSFDSSFQLVLRSTPSSRPGFASSISALARFTTSPRFIDSRTIASQRASGGTKNSCSSGSRSATLRVRPSARARSTSSAKRSESRFRKSIEKM